jgi:hypothetical protein
MHVINLNVGSRYDNDETRMNVRCVYIFLCSARVFSILFVFKSQKQNSNSNSTSNQMAENYFLDWKIINGDGKARIGHLC